MQKKIRQVKNKVNLITTLYQPMVIVVAVDSNVLCIILLCDSGRDVVQKTRGTRMMTMMMMMDADVASWRIFLQISGLHGSFLFWFVYVFFGM